MSQTASNTNNDQEHLRLLLIFHLVAAGLAAAFIFYSLVSTAISAVTVNNAMDRIENLVESAEAKTDPRKEKPKDWERKVIENDTNDRRTIRDVTGRSKSSLLVSLIAGSFFYIGIQAFFLTNVCFGAHCIYKRRNHLHLFVSSIITCLMFPFGTVLGIFTILVLIRPSMRSVFTGPYFDVGGQNQ